METGRGANLDITVTQGKTFQKVLRLGGKPFVYKAITGITQAAPMRLHVVGHGLVNGWPAAIVSVKGMTEANAEIDETTNLPTTASFRPVTVVDANYVEFNEVNSSGFSAYTSGGYLQFYTPTDLTGAVVRMTIRDKVGGTALVELDSDSIGGIEVNNTAKTITITIDADVTEALTAKGGVYDAEIQYPSGVVNPLMYGRVAIEKEVTT